MPGAKFTDSVPMEHAGVRHTLHRFNYGQSLDWKGFCGCGDVFIYWMEKDDILAALARFGFADVPVELQPNVHGNALMAAARKR